MNPAFQTKAKVLFIVPYPLGKAPSQRFRIEQFFPALQEEGISYEVASFFDEKTWKILYGRGSVLQKFLGLVKGYCKRIKLLIVDIHRYDVFIIHREAAPLGPPLFEFLLSKIYRKKYIFDFDDAIWAPKVSSANNLAKHLKSFWKIQYLCKWAFINTPGNHFLESFAVKSGTNKTVYIPTVVDTDTRYIPRKREVISDKNAVVIGWTGSHSTIHYLESCVKILKKLKQTENFRLMVIADRKPEFDFECEFVLWNEQSEIESLQLFDIGIMPLLPDAWSEGKCGFKIIQYMAVGIPAIASYTGANAAIIDHKVNGYICDTEEQWLSALIALIRNPEKRLDMGLLARKKIENQFSIKSQKNKFIQTISDCRIANS